MNLQEIKNKYCLDNNQPIAIGDSNEIKWLIEQAEKRVVSEQQWELLKIELQQRLEFHERCHEHDEAEINLIHDIQSTINQMETGEYYK